MEDVISKAMKMNLRARSRDRVDELLKDILGGETIDDRGSNTIGDFSGEYVEVCGVVFDVMVPSGPDSALARVIDSKGEGIDSIHFAVDDMDRSQAALAERGIEFARRQNFNGNDVAFVRPGDACGISREFIQGPPPQRPPAKPEEGSG
ncbi:MAG: hypothetical protein GY724_22975 [Actinomycetia bacterium]|nr:hypothetical protein [Actinomycetes bacterium]MCP5034054.1 hypothetical protein [Actinomycetes bacterium]